ncbi:MAG: hypothetical protein AAF682_27400 [Planctomycetota bacterium]
MIFASHLFCLPLFLSAAPTQEAPLPPEGVQLRMYDVRDLSLESLVPAPEGESEAERAERRAAEHRAFAEIVFGFAQPPIASHSDASVASTPGGMLVVSGTGQQHGWIEAFLEEQRRAFGALYLMSFRLVSVPSAATEGLGFGGTEPDVFAPLDDAPVEDFLRGVAAIEGAEVLTAPRVACFARQKATVQSLRPTAYVARYELHHNVQPGNLTIADPVIETVQEGFVVEARAIPAGGGLAVLDFSLSMAELEELRPEPTPHGDVAVPLVARHSYESALSMPLGGTAIFGGLETAGVRTYLLVQVEEALPTFEEPERLEEPAGHAPGERRGR